AIAEPPDSGSTGAAAAAGQSVRPRITAVAADLTGGAGPAVAAIAVQQSAGAAVAAGARRTIGTIANELAAR
ncbi:hypothetical protein OSI10_18140, partial [Mycobacterium ulcerans]